jgi:SAM-dependent methyltransferase
MDFINRSVLRQVRQIPGYPDLDVLDLSCGEGLILSALAGEGCRARGTHYRDDDYIVKETTHLEGLDILKGVDLHTALPFSNDELDVVLLTEVIEHLESYLTVIREVGRILRPGGHLILTTPNTYRLHSRMNFFFLGHHRLIHRRLSWDVSPADLYAHHINMVDFPLLHTVLHHSGLHIDRLFFTRVKARHFYTALPYLLQYVLTAVGGRVGKRRSELESAGLRDQDRWMTHPAMAFSEQLALVARKSVPDTRGA